MTATGCDVGAASLFFPFGLNYLHFDKQMQSQGLWFKLEVVAKLVSLY